MKLYLFLIFATLIAKFSGFYLLPFVILVFPIIFLEKERFGINTVWNFSVLTLIPVLFLYGIEYTVSLFILAFAEEVFFRAYLMKNYSNLIVSIMFVVPHLILYTDFHSVLTFFPSIIFGYMYVKTGSLMFVTIVHTISNIIYEKLLPVLLPEHLEYLLRMPLG